MEMLRKSRMADIFSQPLVMLGLALPFFILWIPSLKFL
jgi:hypothetical protein